jgi:hypothetical protein
MPKNEGKNDWYEGDDVNMVDWFINVAMATTLMMWRCFVMTRREQRNSFNDICLNGGGSISLMSIFSRNYFKLIKLKKC